MNLEEIARRLCREVGKHVNPREPVIPAPDGPHEGLCWREIKCKPNAQDVESAIAILADDAQHQRIIRFYRQSMSFEVGVLTYIATDEKERISVRVMETLYPNRMIQMDYVAHQEVRPQVDEALFRRERHDS